MWKSKRSMLIAAAFAAIGLAGTAVCLGGTQVTLGINVDPSQTVSMDQVDHQAWDRLLQKYVDSQGDVAYAAWKQSPDDLAALDRYLNQLSTADPRRQAGRDTRMAFWINAYNAVTIRGILREYPTSSIRNHTAAAFGYNIWDDLLLLVGGRGYSLREIEHDVLRKMDDPRIHFAIVCASRSCPRLLNRAYTAEDLEEQLVANTRDFFASPRNFRFDANSDRMQLSSIMRWFRDDFGDSQAERLRSIAPYLPNRRAYDAAITNQVSLSYLRYDWSLNDQQPALRN